MASLCEGGSEILFSLKAVNIYLLTCKLHYGRRFCRNIGSITTQPCRASGIYHATCARSTNQTRVSYGYDVFYHCRYTINIAMSSFVHLLGRDSTSFGSHLSPSACLHTHVKTDSNATIGFRFFDKKLDDKSFLSE
ncbi:hypothetical protein ANN_15311 [Periplaneta americana]|uniref:Uncharacterized protein n=1 Tax=Periplaneta americana TaxID=6978 RepID=A0ABQ8SGP2_PERAM|nr:hypothetical protein ANN_15311 [Periplaneta americana]